MKIAVISDTHLGYKHGTEQGTDAFEQAAEAMDTAVEKGADVILLPGDIFDSRLPRQEILAQSFELLHKAVFAKNKNNVSVSELVDKDGGICPIAVQGIPVIAIHGTHERRGAYSVNAVEMLEKAGFLLHLHRNGVILDVNGDKLCVQGLSGIPEKDVKGTLKEWNPKPIPGCKNVFVFHQSMKEHIYSDEQETFISVDDLPAGFDLYIDGHIHWSSVMDKDKKIFFPGSTVITQQKKKDAEKKKGFFMIDIDDNVNYEFVELQKQRPFHYKVLSFEKATVKDIVGTARESVKDILEKHEGEKKPLIRLKLTGNMEKGKTASDVNDADIAKDFDAVITVSKELESDNLRKRIEDLREMQKKKMSVDEIGLKLIDDLLKETNYKGLPPEQILDALAEGENDFVIKKVIEGFEKCQS